VESWALKRGDVIKENLIGKWLQCIALKVSA
jgi:hypothetical protein